MNTLYPITLQMEFADNGGESLTAKKDVSIPFVPFIGLDIRLPKSTFHVQRVIYGTAEQKVTCLWSISGFLKARLEQTAQMLNAAGWAVTVLTRAE